jgi:menaquinone-dependent protoporphyrinogen oxidase
MRILVAYASKYGSTKGIAEFIGKTLQSYGTATDVRDVDSVKNPEAYDAFIVGSAVYVGHWMKEAKQFISCNKTLLATRPVWLFSSGPIGAEAKDPRGRDYKEVSKPKEFDELKNAINPRDHHVFFGAFDGSKLTGMYALGWKMAQKSKTARESMVEGDFRDWNEIEIWTKGIATCLVPSATA